MSAQPDSGPSALWEALLLAVRQRVSRQNFEVWFSDLKLLGVDATTLLIQVPNSYFQSWMEANYLHLMLEELQRVEPALVSIEFVLDAAPTVSASPVESTTPTAEEPLSGGSIDVTKTFSTFVIGSSNQFAAAAARAVADRPAHTYNPLFLFGGVGLGKTHLLHAIGNEMASQNPGIRVLYITCEEFVNELINSIRYGRMAEFRNRFRTQCDALLVDDIQFLGGKLRTQEEFFYTFNALHGSGRQIVVSSDKFPKDIQGLEERLRNRFEWGLIADIQPPDMETKVAILKRKASDKGVVLPDAVSHYLASYIKSNVRELEGALTRLIALSQVSRRPIDLAFTQDAMRQLLDTPREEITVDSIQEAVARFYNLKSVDLRSQRKHKQLVWPRQIAMYLARRHTACSFPEIGQRFGGRDHTTVIHAVKKVESSLQENADLGEILRSMEKSLGL